MSAVLKGVEHDFRLMTEDDVSDVLEIEKQVYEFPWTVGIFRDCLRMDYGCWIYEQAGRIVAYGVINSAVGETHLLNLSVAPEVQRTGLGRFILNYLISVARRHQSEIILLEVRPSNHAALALYDKAGFNEVGVRRNYYPARTGREDALILALTIVP